jgi:hypothetical protein
MKWAEGSVSGGRGVISRWRMISPEEVGHEAFLAIARQDYARLHLLFMSDADMQKLNLPAGMVNTIRANQQQAQQKFANLCRNPLLAGAGFDVVEGGVAECDTRHEVEIIRYAGKQIRIKKQGGGFEFLNTHEMIQVGMAWRLVDVPSFGAVIPPPGGGELEKLLQQLADLDSKQPPSRPIRAQDPSIETYYRKRVPLIQKIIPLDKEANREGWYKQLFDNLLAMAQNSGDKATIASLTQMKDDVVRKMPGSNLAAYGTYREMWCRYSLAMAKTPPPTAEDTKKIQDNWLAELAEFTKKYPRADDTPEALHQLAIGCEFDGKNEESKRWYRRLYEDFPNHALASRARGSEARLNLVGNDMRLVAPYLNDPSKAFDIAQLRGKVVVVHYWGSYSDQYKDDFVRLQRVVASAKDVVLVNINLDDSAAKARDAVARAQAPGYHLFEASNNASGLNSRPATQYGIHMLPTIFVVGANGRVIDNNVQVGDVATALKKAQ